MRPEVNSSRLEISNCLEESFRLHGSFTIANLEISIPFKNCFVFDFDFTAAAF